jgi:serine/threonine protein phosphatase PrpC
MKPTNDQDTGEYRLTTTLDDVLPPQTLSFRVEVDLAALSHQGNVRANNEDHYLIVRTERALQTLLTNLPEGYVPRCFAEVAYGMLVADGMGGMAAGEVASRLAISTLVNLVLNTPDWIMRLSGSEAEEVMRRMTERYHQTDDVLCEQGQNDPRLSGMGTTMTLACSLGHDLILTHVGDSRAYLLRAGELHQLTRDQTLAQSLADRGIIRQEDTATHRLRHTLTSALGVGRGRLEPEVQHISLVHEDQVLLCSDGLTEMVDNSMIRAVLHRPVSASDSCRALIDLALRNGGKDNVTVLLARYRFPQTV